MATRDTGQPSSGISRRDFLKTSAAVTAVVGCGIDFAFDAQKASAYEGKTGANGYTIKPTTCPYCSASCGQRVVVKNDGAGNPTNEVVDIYGDFESPMNAGGLCSKGAGSLQLVNNPRRIGAFAAPHPGKNMNGAADDIFAYDPAYTDGIAYRRIGNGNWSPLDLTVAMNEIAGGATVGADSHLGLVAYRNADVSGDWADPTKKNSKAVAFFGSSHMNNEPNYVYRKLIANFGTSNVEHQARI
jgi:formate dehydrogenase major subunit